MSSCGEGWTVGGVLETDGAPARPVPANALARCLGRGLGRGLTGPELAVGMGCMRNAGGMPVFVVDTFGPLNDVRESREFGSTAMGGIDNGRGPLVKLVKDEEGITGDGE